MVPAVVNWIGRSSILLLHVSAPRLVVNYVRETKTFWQNVLLYTKIRDSHVKNSRILSKQIVNQIVFDPREAVNN